MDGRVDLRVGLDRDPATVNQQSRLPGRIFENLIILGSATNQEYASAPGDIRAFDVRTGSKVWTFHTVPRPGEFGYDTWPEDAWKTVGGANNWAEQSIDVKRGIVYIPTGSPKYNFYGGHRKGANLFGDCLIALDVRTGKRLWHFQTVHHDIWDLDNNSAPQLTTIRQNGRNIDVVAMASKTGYLYVFDRVTGQPIWPIEERPVPQKTTVPGEALWPTQPFPTKPPPFSRQKFTVDDLNPHILTPEEREQFRQRILKARNEGPFTPIGFDEVIHMPGNQGGSNWGSTAANPTDGSVYVIGFNVPTIIRLLKPGEMRAGRAGAPPEVVKEGRYVTEGFGLYPTIVNPPYTTLTAYDLNQGTIRWQIGLGDDLRLAAQGVKGTGTAGTTKGGIIPTATGLLFVTAADRKVHVYDSTQRQTGVGASAGRDDQRFALYVRARRTTVPSRHGIGCGRPRRRTWWLPTPTLLPPQDRRGSWPTRCPGTDSDARQSPFRYDRAMGHKRRTRKHGVFREHSLSLTVIAILAVWFVLYVRGDPSTHLGSFYGNALADWLGTFLIVIATKYFYEIGSAESRPPHPKSRGPVVRFLVDHSLTILLVTTGAAWAVCYARMDPNGKAGQVVGNVVSEWTQVLGLVVITKYTHEIRSKEGVTLLVSKRDHRIDARRP